MAAHQSPLIAEIDNDSLNIIDEMKDLDGRLKSQDGRLASVREFSKSVADYDLRSQWEDSVKRLEIVYKEDKALFGVMSDIKSLYQQKKKATVGGGECPPAVQSKLIDKVMEFKKERIRIEAEIKDIDEDFAELAKVNAGEFADGAPRMKQTPKEESRSKFMTQLKYLSPESVKKKPKEFVDYLANYEVELSKSLMQSQPGTQDFRERMFELGKVSEMKALFLESQRQAESQAIRGYDATALRPRDLAAVDGSALARAGTAKLQLDSFASAKEKAQLDERDEELLRLQNKLSRMNETIRGLDQLNKEKEKLAVLQREKYEMLERERYEVEILKLKADREKEEADHMRRLQKMGAELDYIEQLKAKSVSIVSAQIEEFAKVEESRWAARRKREQEFNQEELNKLQLEFLKREERRKADFEQQMKQLEGKYDKALGLIESQQLGPDTFKLLLQEKVKDRMSRREAGSPVPDEGDLTDDAQSDDRFKSEMHGVTRRFGNKPSRARDRESRYRRDRVDSEMRRTGDSE